jgi:OOP family OmpA-OmpF porin
MRASRFLSLSLGVLALALPSVASAQSPAPSIDARTWRPSTDPGAGMVLEPTITPGAWNWNVGAWANYAYRSVTIDDPATGARLRPVKSFVGLDLVASLGLGKHVSLGLSLPTAIYQTGTRSLPASISSSGEAPTSAIGDLGLHGKMTILDASEGGFGLAGLVTVTVPTGDPSSFLSEGSMTAGARLLAEYTMLVASVQASLGYTVRTSQPTVGAYQFGDTIPWTFGFTIRPDLFKIDPTRRQRWEVALHGWLPVTPVGPFGLGDPGSAKETPVLVSLADRIELGHFRDTYAVGGVDVGITDAIGVPNIRFVAAIGWAPRNHDMDNDGVPDDVDQCPELPEDHDGFEDRDGCPELDNDDDGILDRDDACPNVAGIATDDPKTNGCPDTSPQKVGDRDHDGVPDDVDRCPDQPEDRDGNRDEDGCPDPDDDGDGIADVQDACPREPGEPSTNPKKNGCPNPDRDGDTYDNTVDKCPDEPETWNGVQDDDGCPDTGGKPLVVVKDDSEKKNETKNGHVRVVIAAGDKLVVDGPTLRAIVTEMNRHREWTLLVAVRGAKALDAAGAIADSLDRLAHREVAEAIAWDAVAKEPATTANAKIVVVVGSKKEPALAPLPAAKP